MVGSAVGAGDASALGAVAADGDADGAIGAVCKAMIGSAACCCCRW